MNVQLADGQSVQTNVRNLAVMPAAPDAPAEIVEDQALGEAAAAAEASGFVGADEAEKLLPAKDKKG